MAALEYLGAVRPEVDSVLQKLVDDVRAAFGTDLALVNLILPDVQYFRVWSGDLPSEFAETREVARERTMCQYVVENEAPLVVEDFLATEKFKDQYFCVNHGVQFYAGAPLLTSDGVAVGTLCLIHEQPMEFGEDRLVLLEVFARAVVGRLELLGALARERGAREKENLRARELRQTLEVSQDIIATVGVDGAIQSINSASRKILGYEPEELVGRRFLDLLHPEDRGGAAGLGGVLGGEESAGIESRCLRKNGEAVWVEWHTTPPSEKGTVCALARDITERKRAVEDLRRSEARNRAVVETATDAIVIMESDGLICSFNPAAERTFGYTAEEVVGEPLRILMPERFRSLHEAGFRRYSRAGRPTSLARVPWSSPGCARTASSSRWNSPWARCARRTPSSSPASFAILPGVRRPKRRYEEMVP